MDKSLYDNVIADYDLNFHSYWKTIFTEYRSSEYDRHMWLAGPSSYVFSLAGVRFATDLQIRRGKDLDREYETLAEDLSDISFILITHQHDDHMSPKFMRSLKDTDIRWYIPYGVREDLIESSEVKRENIIFVRPGDIIEEGALSIRVFDTPHLTADEVMNGEVFIEVGYEISSPYGKILMPADVRNYEYDKYPGFSDIDLVISHVWAGNNAIDESLYMPMLDKFISFSAEFKAKKYYLCHLYEIGRKELYMWHDDHADVVIKGLRKLLPGTSVEVPRIGQKYMMF